jgi:ferritin-like metal-binding protein YciE
MVLSRCEALQSTTGRDTMATAPKALDDMFHDLLKDVYYAEKQILKALPKMARAAKSPELRKAFETHRDETEGHIERLSDVFEAIGKAPRGKTCDAILGILEEGKAVMEDYADSPALDAGLVASAQAVEHYEMTRYGTLKAWAQQLEHKEAAALLDATLAEETKTDELLTKISSSTNSAAVAKAKVADRPTAKGPSSEALRAFPFGPVLLKSNPLARE